MKICSVVSAVAALLLVAVIWTGLYTVPEGMTAMVRSPWTDSKRIDPGRHWRPPCLSSHVLYPLTEQEYILDSQTLGSTLATLDDRPLRLELEVHATLDRDRVSEVDARFPTGDLALAVAAAITPVVTGVASRHEFRDFFGEGIILVEQDLRDGSWEALRLAGFHAGAVKCGKAILLSGENESQPGPGPDDSDPRVVLLGLDAADWDLLEPLMADGRMPNLRRLCDGGVRGSLRTIAPALSPVVWTSMATARSPEEHGIVDFISHTSDGRTVPVTSNLRRVPGFWNILTAAGASVGVAGWWATWPAEAVKGYMLSDRYSYGLFRDDTDGDAARAKMYPETAIFRMAAHHIGDEEITFRQAAPFMDIEPRIYADADGEDLRESLRWFRRILASDLSYRNAGLYLQKKYNPRLAATYFEGTDTICHQFVRFRAPMRVQAPERETAMFKDTIDRFYEYHDRLIGEFTQGLSEDTVVIVCSDHGFLSGSRRPPSDPRIGVGAAAEWHRKFGIILLHGSPFTHGAELVSASVLDLTPTLLMLFGQPLERDMSGRVLVEAFTDAYLIHHGITYVDAYPDLETREEAVEPMASALDSEIVERLRGLGYLGGESGGFGARTNLGSAFMERGEFLRAIEEFKKAVQAAPDAAGGYVNLANACHRAGRFQEALEAAGRALLLDPESTKAM
ncbi:alkaline phosphatase family protein, partial [bacterium]|nr:alkaline phosphatase family protein [candidate division CSSED10-310 bacterium]